MIHFAAEETKAEVRQMWKTCFGDSEEYMDLFFSRVYANENTLIYFDGGKAVASLQMLPYTISFYGSEVPFAYLAGLCTLPEARKKGYMAQLIYAAHAVLRERNVPLSILVPAEDWLFGFYEKYGYLKVFEGGQALPSLQNILHKSSTMEEAYALFDAEFRSKNLCVQKSFQDFETIVEEAKIEDFAQKENLSAMAYIVEKNRLIDLFAQETNGDTELLKSLDNTELCKVFFESSDDEPMINYMLE